MTAILARNVHHRWFRASAGARATLLSETQPGTWLVIVTDMRGHDRAAYLPARALIFDPLPDLHMEDAA